MKSEMTSRERVLESLRHKETDRVPFSLGFGINAPALVKLQEYWGLKSPGDAYERMLGRSDLRGARPVYAGPKDRKLTLSDGSTVDLWGVKRKPVCYGDGCYDEICGYPLAEINDISGLNEFTWPTPDWWDVSGLKEMTEREGRSGEYAVMIGNGNIFESSWYMRGLERMFTDLIEAPELAWEIMRRVTDYFVGFFEKVLRAAEGMIDIVFTADDIGQQQGLLLSLDMWEKMIKPHHARLNKVLHNYGVKVMYHTDGSVMEAIPGLIGMEIDILDPLQFDAKGMDPARLKSDFGERLCFHGGVSVQKTLPFGTADDVRKEVADRIRVLGKNGGYILAPSHAIQAGTPPENIAAMLEAIGREKWGERQ